MGVGVYRKAFQGTNKVCAAVAIAIVTAILLPASLPGQENKGEKAAAVTPQSQAIREKAEKLLVKVMVKLNKDQTIDPATSGYDDQLIELIYRGGRFFAQGVILSKDGLVVISDPRVGAGDIEKIEVTAFNGKKYSAHPVAITRRAPGLLVKIDGNTDDLVDIGLDAKKELKFGDKITLASLSLLEDKMAIVVNSAAINTVESDGTIQFASDNALLFDGEGIPAGILLDVDEQSHHRMLYWRLSEFQEENRVPLRNIEQTQEALKGVAAPWSVKVRFFLKRDEEAEAPSGMEDMGGIIRGRRRYSSRSEEGGDLENTRYLGVALDNAGTVLIAAKFPVQVINQLGDIEATDSNGKTHKGTFVGAFKELGAMIVKFPDLKAASLPVVVREPKLGKGDIFFTLSQEKKKGEEYIEASYNRIDSLILDELELEKEVYIHHEEHKVRDGSVIVGKDGELLGFYTTKEKDGQTFSGRRRYYSPDEGGEARIVYCHEIRDELASPQNYFDPRAIVHSREEKGKLIWLGVEWQAVDRNVAERMGILKETGDGRRGLIVTTVYPDSPAAKIGLEKGDTLLSLLEEGKGENDRKEFIAAMGYEGYGMYESIGGLARYRPDMMPFAQWKGTNNYLTALLTKIGKGKAVTLTYLKGKGQKEAKLTLEESPSDQSNAKPYKCKPLGLTVKDLTYEVKHFMRYAPEKNGVVISRVEPGSGAAVARLYPSIIVLKVNNIEVKDQAHFRELIEEIGKKSPENVTLYCESPGQSMFAEVQAKWSAEE